MGLVGGLLWLALALGPALGAAEPTADPETSPVAPQGAPASVARPASAAANAWGPIERAWFSPARSLEERVRKTRRASLEFGVWSLDAAARAVLAGASGGEPVERERAALRLAPDLPLAHMELARALWLHGGAPVEALRTAVSALFAIPRHIEASLWFTGSLLYVLALAFAVGGLVTIFVVGMFAARNAAHDLGDVVSSGMPNFSRAALLASLLLLPLVLGEGVLGMALPLLALGAAYGGMRQRAMLAAAAVIVVVGAFPLARLSAGVLQGFAADPVAAAAVRAANDFAFPADLTRLEAASESVPLARQALARRARRSGNLGAADGHYQALLVAAPDDPVVANNAANVRLSLGHMESALELYRTSVELDASSVVLFNLSQAHGRAFQVEELATVLARAQELDPMQVAELTQLQGAEPEGFVVDLPLSQGLVWRRVLNSNAGADVADELRAPLAPGLLGSSPWLAGVGALLAIGVGSLAGMRLRPSVICTRCGRRMCPRCHGALKRQDLCEGCVSLFRQPETTDRDLRLARVEALRVREERLNRAATIVSLLIPGSAGLLAKQPLSSLLGAVSAALVVLLCVFHRGVAPDPLVAGGSAPLAFLGLAVLAALVYALVVAIALSARRSA